ncbi:UPF0389 protein CG9231-like [Penaeus japonicus]|uniref:UPF0389 protein CG9231-like n=1 Tax=Penaeus japonicus TaxID=27405 RepID=UPI001C710938|nr:UPF0389 protein CG9231-like [Penaeus japonicus]
MMALRGTLGKLPALRSSVWTTSPRILAVPARKTHSTEDKLKDIIQAAPATAGVSGRAMPAGKLGLRDHPVNRLEKYLLVWGGKYKSIADVPDLVSQDALERARNKARIKINIWMGVATLFGCIYMIWSGKKAHREGQSLLNMNVEWHRKVNEEAKLAKEREARLGEAAKQ